MLVQVGLKGTRRRSGLRPAMSLAVVLDMRYPIDGRDGAAMRALEEDLRSRLSAPAENLDQALFVSEDLPQTGRVMVKDEDLCVHCGLCAERCPTAACCDRDRAGS